MAASRMSTFVNLTTISQTDSKVESVISGHCFYNAVTVTLPGANSIPESLSECFADQLYYKIHSLPVYRLMEVPFIHAFVKKGSMHMLSANTRLDTHDCVAVTPTGWLILHLTKDTYIEFGLEAVKQTHQQKSSDIHVVKINLLASHFKPGKKNYESTLWCLKNRLGLVFDFYIAWEPEQEEICSSSVSSYFMDKCNKVERGHLTRITKVLTSLPCPRVKADDPEGKSGEEACHFQEVFEWMGALACGVDLCANDESASYASSLSCPEPSQNCPRCCLFQASGFLTPGTILRLFNALRMYAEANPDCPPPSLTTHGFRDSPVLHTNSPHHLYMCGDNLMAFLYLPDNQCWLFRAVAS